MWKIELVAKMAFENDPCQKMTRLSKKKKNSASTISEMAKKMGGKILNPSKKHLLIEATVQKCLEKSICLLNDLKNHENRIPIFYDEKFLPLDSAFNKQNDLVVAFGNDV